jgi:hypothetical protein
VIVRLVKFLLTFGLVFVIFRAFFPPRRGASPAAAPKGGVDLVRDRVCNTFLPRARALPAVVAGREEYFCSAACHERALSMAKAS